MKKIKIAKPYKPFARKILVTDFLQRGFPMPYEVLDDTGRAYVLNSTDQEVRTSVFEGKWVPPVLFRIATFPKIRKEDNYYVPNLKKLAKEQAKEAILKMEDERLLALLEGAVGDYNRNEDHKVSPNHVFRTSKSQNYEQALDKAVSAIIQHGLDVKNILVNPASVTDELKAKAKKKKYKIVTSILVDVDTTFVLTESSYLGVIPIMYDLDVEPMAPNDQLEIFSMGWVGDEMIGMLILNPRGIAIVKNSNQLD